MFGNRDNAVLFAENRTMTRLLLMTLVLLAAPAHAREWIGAWIPYEARETLNRQMEEAKRILATPDDKLTPAELKWKREWQRR
jgi:hypothetical protein